VQATASHILAGALLCATVGARASAARDDEKKAVPVYTNDDLDRVSPLRAQTGGSTAVAEPPKVKPEPQREGHRHDETYWRREAERLQDRLQPLRDRVEDLRARIEERRRNPRVRPYSDPTIESWQRRVAGLEQRIREGEDRLHERARRAGIPPGWLR
jgi:hypothetical protein